MWLDPPLIRYGPISFNEVALILPLIPFERLDFFSFFHTSLVKYMFSTFAKVNSLHASYSAVCLKVLIFSFRTPILKILKPSFIPDNTILGTAQ